ncbi:MAG: CRISPR-associated endonuclease Csy4 [Flavobacteriales bacterium]|jgi:CRISPR-associated endonuclease Csy4
MKYYLEITLLPTDDIGHYFLWSKIYQQLHFWLVKLTTGKGGEVGFSFPEYSTKQPRLGRKIRIFAESREALTQLNTGRWLERLSDYCHISSIRSVPEQTQYAVFGRKQFRTNPERLARRRAKRKGETYEQALAYFSGFEGQLTNLPFVDLESLSTSEHEHPKRRFKLFVTQRVVLTLQKGQFSCYGLSSLATVPWF